MIVRHATESDFDAWWCMRLALWSDADTPQDRQDMHDSLQRDEVAVLVAQDESANLIGFLEAGIRYAADGCASRNVGYVEGWYVQEEHRRQGVGAALVEEAERWARSRGCVEMASDCELANDVSFLAHLRLGYEEVERTIHFRKTL